MIVLSGPLLLEVKIGKVTTVRLGRFFRVDLLLGGVEDVRLLVQIWLFFLPGTVVCIGDTWNFIQSNWIFAPG